jgi:hypothetical protein
MSSATEAELGALFINSKTAASMHHTLKELGHPQAPTPMQTDNKTTHELLTNKIMPKALKAMDMHFHWLSCREAQGQFRYYWRPGTQNLADYFTKHHPASHHKTNRPTFLTLRKDPQYTKLLEKLFIYLALAKPALTGQFIPFVSSQSKANALKYFCLFRCAAQN